jgi:hypothetical protein
MFLSVSSYELIKTVMNNRFSKRIGALTGALLIFSTLAFSQFDNLDFLRAGTADGLTYLKSYIAPWTNAFGAALNGGWYNTAKPHKLGGFDITLGINAGFVPSSATTFDVSKIGLTTLIGNGMASTVAGPDVEGPTLTAAKNGITLASFRTPPGADWKIIPAPILQAGIGLPFGTELKVRYLPKINISDGDLSLWGIGLVHSLIQYLPGNKLLPFDVSLFGAYTKLKGDVPLSLQPEESFPTNYASYNTATSFQDQNMSAIVTAMNVGVIASLNLPVLTVYGGLGYTKTSTEIKLTGNYPLPTINPAISITEPVYEDAGVIKGFAPLEIKNFSGLRANIGLRVKLAVVTIHADYTRANYNVVSAGLGISFR